MSKESNIAEEEKVLLSDGLCVKAVETIEEEKVSGGVLGPRTASPHAEVPATRLLPPGFLSARWKLFESHEYSSQLVERKMAG